MYILNELDKTKRHIANGYYRYHIPDHHLADKNGNVYEHMIMAETMLGRELKDGEVVHHKDRNRLNNSIDNLMVFKTNADHAAYHSGDEIYKDGDVYIAIKKKRMPSKKSGKYYYIINCPICGCEMASTAKMCINCRKKESSKNIPPKEKLIEILKNNSFLAAGKIFGVSDNAVRKWCKKYGIPYKKKEIKEFLAS